MSFWNKGKRWILWPLALFFSFLVGLRNKFFDTKVLKIKKLPRPVVSIGNISVGGSGKTAVLMTLLQSPRLNLGQGFCVLTRGYGACQNRKQSLWVPRGRNDPQVYSDEPTLIRNSTDSEVIIDSQRYRGGRVALDKKPELKAFFLDDGFQHRGLHRDLDIIVFDAYSYFQNPGLMPQGRFREPLSSLKRADIILLSKWENYSLNQGNKLLEILKERYKKPVYKISSKILGLKTSQGKEYLWDSKIVLLSAIGNPYVFETDMQVRFGKDHIIKHFIFPDHYDFKKENVYLALEFARKNEALVVCTAKDAVKIKSDEIYIADQQLDLPEAVISKVREVVWR